jgi:hypothetical protein
MAMVMTIVPPSLLVGLANRCLMEPASRALDAEIYCAFHNIADGNDLASAALVEARHKGEVLLIEPGVHGWIDVPPFTSELRHAKSLVPDGLLTISRDPLIICATALTALAITRAPPNREPVFQSGSLG